MCSSGNIPAHATAKSVIASANRLIDVRHFWRSSKRIAEIKVPAWPIPIHQTKLTIANPHPTGILIPQIPTPTTSRYVTAYVSSISNANAIANPKYQPFGGFLDKTMELILSVTEAYVCPGSSTGGFCAGFIAGDASQKYGKF